MRLTALAEPDTGQQPGGESKNHITAARAEGTSRGKRGTTSLPRGEEHTTYVARSLHLRLAVK